MTEVSTRPVVILGAGGHARVLLDALRLLGVEVLGFAAPPPLSRGALVDGAPVLGDDDAILAAFRAESVALVNGLGSVRDTRARRALYERFVARGYSFRSVVHPSAIVARDVLVGDGAQLLARVVVNPGARIEADAIVNTGAIVEHDCVVGAHAHLAPGVTLSGAVSVGAGAHVGTGATVIQGVRVGANALVGAGAVVVSDVAEGAVVLGVPARAR